MNKRGVAKLSFKKQGFTLVELLIVIAIIAILATIIVVAYIGVTKNAVIASMQSDLTGARDQIKLYQLDNKVFPNSITDCPTPAAGNICAKTSPGNVYTYNVDNTAIPQSYGLTAVNASNKLSYRLNSVSAAPVACAPGFIIVPGSTTYGTSDFCVMKYEAKQVGATTTPISQAAGLPWVSISQTTAIANAPNVANCTNCHLITEAERMTIAQNVLSVSENWDNGAGVHNVGVGYIYSGHNDDAPPNAIIATIDDSDGYNGTANVAPSNQKRTLSLTNGEIIWDFAGNAAEWTTGVIAAGQQPGLSGDVSYTFKEWDNGSLLMNGLPALSQPSSTGISGITGWDSTQGIGELNSNMGEAALHGFRRGGAWYPGAAAGVLALSLAHAPNSIVSAIGFRVSR